MDFQEGQLPTNKNAGKKTATGSGRTTKGGAAKDAKTQAEKGTSKKKA